MECAVGQFVKNDSRTQVLRRTVFQKLPLPRPPSAKSVQYEGWDSRPQLSELTEVEPQLRPSSWKTASHYGSLGDLFAPT